MNNVYRLLFLLCLACLAGCTTHSNTYAPVVDAWREPISKQGVHTVEPGETLYSIAWRYGFDYREVAKINRIPPPYAIHAGQSIYLVAHKPSKAPPKRAPKAQAPSATKVAPVVKSPVKQATVPMNTPKVTTPAVKSTPSSKSSSKVSWSWPANGAIIGYYAKDGLSNKGIDIAGKLGDPVYAAAAGVVVYSGNGLFGYGNLIIIKHDNEYLSAYAHNNKNWVTEGMSVKAQQKIAEIGKTGSHRVKLHFEIRQAGKPVDPMVFLPSRSR